MSVLGRSPSRHCSLLGFLTALLTIYVPASAAGPGTSAATFLNLGFGARPIGLGEAFVAVADDASALHYNPAGLAFPASAQLGSAGRKYELLASHALHIQDISLSQMGLLRRPWGLSLTRLGISDIERRTSETVQPEGRFGASDTLFGASYARMVGPVGVGVTGKFIQQQIGEYSATAFAADIGLLKKVPGWPLSLGAGVANLGTGIRFIDESYPLPMTVRLGVAAGMTAKFPHVFALQLDLPRDSGPAVRLGMEYLGFGPFALRAGYRTQTGAQRDAVLGKALGSSASGISEFYGMFMGAGFRSKLGNMDYAILPYGELGTAHRFTFSLGFGGAPAQGPIGVFK